MALDLNIHVLRVDAPSNDERNGLWRVHFFVDNRFIQAQFDVGVEQNCPAKDVVARAMNNLNMMLSHLSEKTSDWKLPAAAATK